MAGSTLRIAISLRAVMVLASCTAALAAVAAVFTEAITGLRQHIDNLVAYVSAVAADLFGPSPLSRGRALTATGLSPGIPLDPSLLTNMRHEAGLMRRR